MNTPDPRNVPLRVRLPFGSEAEFIERFGPNVTHEGVFIPTRAPKPEGTPLRFELVLADGARLLRGEAVVAHTHEEGAGGAGGGGARGGMTLRFVRLDPHSEALLERLLGTRAPLRTPVPEDAPPPPASAVPPPPAPKRRSGPAGLQPRAPLRAAPPEPSPPGPLTAPPAPPPGPPGPPVPPLAAPTPRPAPAPEPAAPARTATPPPATVAPPPVPLPRAATPPPADLALAAPSRPTPSPAEPSRVAPSPATPPPPPAPAPPTPAPTPSRGLETPAPREGRRAPSEGPGRAPAADAPPAVAPLSRRAEPELVLGVDLGTSHVRVAVFSQGQLLLLTPATEELPGLPAMVAPADPAAPDGEALVGEAARERRLEAPGQVAAGLKRLLGRRGRSARMLEHAVWAVPAVRTDAQGLAALALGGHTVAVGGLAAQLLREVAAVAARQLGRPVRRAVLCVPSHFTDAQRGALLAAARQAGLEVLRLVNEASAAALAFGQGRALARKRLLIYDLGGGTFDASVVEVTGDDVEVVSTGGDNFLGGVDLDARVEYELRRQMTEAGLAPPAPDSPEGERLRGAAEAAKRALSAHEEVEVTLASVARDAQGLPADFSTPLSRTRLEELTADLVERTLEVTLDVVRAASVTPQGLDEVLLLGGQSRSPHVRRRLEEALGRPVRAGEDVEASVARGAALLGHALVRAAQGKGPVVLAEVLSTPVGIAERGGTFRRVLERNTRLPAQKTLVLPVRAGEPLSLALLQGSAPLVEDNEFLGARTLQPERDGELQVHFDMGADGTLALAVTPPGGKRAELALERAEPDAEGLAGLLAAAPPGEAPPPGPGGLLGGLKRLFGRR